MRILFLSHYYAPEGNAPATRVRELCRRWAAWGHDVTVITGVPNVPSGVVYEGYRNRWHQVEILDGVRVVRRWAYVAPNKGSVRRIANYLSFMATAVFGAARETRPDILVATSPQFFCGLAGAVASRLCRCPLLLEIRDLWPESIEAVGALANRPLLRLLTWLEQRMYAAATHLVTVGEGYRGKLIERGVPPDQISVVMNGVDREFIAGETTGEAVRREHGLDGAFVCSYVGTVGMACGLEVVLRAAKMLRRHGDSQVRFLIVGDGALLEDLRSQAAALGLDNVVFAGRQPKQRIPEYLAASDVCLVHLRKQALFETVMPSKIFEAAGMARPIINGVAGFAAAFIEKAGAGINIDPENAEQLVAALRRLQADPPTRSAFGNSGRRHVTTHYNRDALARDYLGILTRVHQKSRKQKAEVSGQTTADSGQKGSDPATLPSPHDEGVGRGVG